MGSTPDEFDYLASGDREVRVTRGGRVVTVLRGGAAARFLAEVATGDPQHVIDGSSSPETTSEAASAQPSNTTATGDADQFGPLSRRAGTPGRSRFVAHMEGRLERRDKPAWR